MEKGSVISASGLLEYQPGGVVSRSVLDAAEGTVTVFSFDEGQGLSEHTAPYDALVMILEGTAEVTVSGNPNLLGSGDIIVMPAGEPHSLRAAERFKMMLVMIRAGKGS